MRGRILVPLAALPSLAMAFLPPTRSNTLPAATISSSVVVLSAKKSTKQRPQNSSQSKSNNNRGGFGATPSPKVKAATSVASRDDYAIFPALEPHVKGTLIVSSHDTSDAAAGALPNEIYQRLDQIYGLQNFNYETTTTNESPLSSSSSSSSSSVFSMQDLISGNLEQDDNDNDNNTPNPDDTLFQTISQLDQFHKFRILHVDPLVLAIDDFFTPKESEAYRDMPTSTSTSTAKDLYQTGSLTVGKDAQSQAQRTSTTWFHHYKNVPALMAKASRLLGLDGIDQWEEPQTVRYRKNEQFTWHLDALGPNELTKSQGGQRIATLLVYHTDLDETDGGATIFRDLRDKHGDRLKVQPKKGSALLFFPAAGGIPNTPLDIRTLHCGESVSETSDNDKWISQLWLRKTPNAYIPTAPHGNTHAAATDAIADYCCSSSSSSL